MVSRLSVASCAPSKVEQDVGWLHIAMHYPKLVCELERFSDLLQHPCHPVEGPRSLVHTCVQVAAANVAHHQVGAA